MLDAAFAEVALAVSGAVGGPFHPGVLRSPGEAVYDDGGSIVEPGEPVPFDCHLQIDVVTESMRTEAAYADGDVRLLILAAGLPRAVDTDATVEITAGSHVGS